MYRSNLKSVALLVPGKIAIEVLVGVVNPNLFIGGRRGSWMVPFEIALVSSCRRSIVTFLYVYAFVLQHVSSPHLCSLPQIFPCSPGNRWMAFGLQKATVVGNCPCN